MAGRSAGEQRPRDRTDAEQQQQAAGRAQKIVLRSVVVRMRDDDRIHGEDTCAEHGRSGERHRHAGGLDDDQEQVDQKCDAGNRDENETAVHPVGEVADRNLGARAGEDRQAHEEGDRRDIEIDPVGTSTSETPSFASART